MSNQLQCAYCKGKCDCEEFLTRRLPPGPFSRKRPTALYGSMAELSEGQVSPTVRLGIPQFSTPATDFRVLELEEMWLERVEARRQRFIRLREAS